MKQVLKNGLLVLVTIAVGLLALGGAARPERAGQTRLLKLSDYKFLDVNTLNVTINSDGTYADERRTGQAGMEWPKGSGKTCVFTAGLWIGGLHHPTGTIRTACMDYAAEYQPGPLLETFNTTTNDGSGPNGRAADNKWRLYKINKSDEKNPGGNADYTDWPGDAGAPFVDVNGNGVWDPGIDKPKFYGDQQLWTVTNDANSAYHNAVGTTAPMGLEVQCLYFGFNQPGALGNMMFMKWKVINKSDATYDSTYISMWSDVDLGDANDDLPGCDTSLSLGYVYNGDNNDNVSYGYGNKPPADGFDFFEGPKIPGSPTDSAIVDGVWQKGFKNLPMTSYVVYTNGTLASIVDPPAGNPNFPLIMYDYMRGKAGTVHQTLISPTTGQPMYKWFSGNPITGTGDLPGNFPLGVFNPQDIRIMLTSGPFTLAQGDTQEVVGAFLIAGGADRLSSVTLLKQYDAIAQNAFNKNFNLPSAPPLPDLNISYLPNELVFDWSVNSATTESYRYADTTVFTDYRFEAYSLYQGESVNGPWHLVAQYDENNGVKTVVDYTQDPLTGGYYLNPVVDFKDTGIKRYFIANQDYILGGPLVNGKQYFFALTTWAYNWDPNALTGGVPLTLEAAKNAITVVPRQPGIGTTIPTSVSEVLPTDRSPQGDVASQPVVIRPDALTGATYTVNINGTGTTVNSWDLIRGADTLVRGSTDFLADASTPIADGIQWMITNPGASVRSGSSGWSYAPSADLWMKAAPNGTSANGGNLQSSIGATIPLTGIQIAGTGAKETFPTSGTAVPIDQQKKIQIRFSSTQTQHAYRYLNKVRTFPKDPIADSAYLPFILFKGTGFVYQKDYASITVPFTVWEVDTLDGNPTPRQLNVGFVENNDTLYNHTTGAFVGHGRLDGKWDPTIADNGGFEPIYIFASTYTDSEQAKYGVSIGANQSTLDVLYIVWVAAKDSTISFTDGDVVQVNPTYPLAAGRQYSVVAPAASYNNTTLMTQDLALINVFPNPYFGGNLAETGNFNRFVTFSHLPQVATIRVFTITGELVRTINHDNNSTFERWDLRNANGLPVASGVYLVNIDIPGAGSRVLKVAVIQPEERPSRI